LPTIWSWQVLVSDDPVEDTLNELWQSTLPSALATQSSSSVHGSPGFLVPLVAVLNTLLQTLSALPVGESLQTSVVGSAAESRSRQLFPAAAS
jgi:hypothetical protein